MTHKLYYSSPYTTNWDTEIIKKFEKNGDYFILLKETAFYPTGGGQPNDTGTIDGNEVLDVFLEDGEVVHKVKNFPLETRVTCQIDWEKRFDHMQHHSGQHLLSAICYKLLNALTVSFHLGSDYVTIDLDTPEITQEQMAEIEHEVNKEVFLNRPIHTYFVTEDELEKISLLKMPKVTKDIRIVEIEGIEHNACGGTHVKNTGEIGLIKLFKTERQKGITRLFFKCGFRALREFNESLSVLAELTKRFNTNRNDIIDRIEKGELEKKRLEDELSIIKAKNDEYISKELLKNVENDVLTQVFEDRSFTDMKELGIKLANEQNLMICFVSTNENKMILLHDGTKAVKCGAFLKENLPAYNGKGGGNDHSAQAAFPSVEDALNFFQFTSQTLK